MDSMHQRNICQIIHKFQKKIQIVPNYGGTHPPNFLPSRPFPSLPSGTTSDNRGLRVINPSGKDGRLRVRRRRVLLVRKATAPSSSLCRSWRRAVWHLCWGQRRREAEALLEAARGQSSAGSGWSTELCWRRPQEPVAKGAAKRIAN